MKRAFAVLLVLATSACSSSEVASPTKPDERVVFEGAGAVSASELLELVAGDLQRYDETGEPGSLSDAAYRIEYRYRLNGFDRVAVTPRVEGKKIIFHIDEGARILLAQVHFDGATVFKPEELKEITPSRFLGNLPPYSRRSLILMEDGLVTAYRDRGYLDVQVTHRTAVQEGREDRMV